MLVMKMEDIKIKPAYKARTPKPAKISACMENYQKYHIQDRYILLDKYGYLVDGYVMYLVLKELGVPYAEVKRCKGELHENRRSIVEYVPHVDYRKSRTKYVYGVHVNGKDNKERIWRVPEKLKDLEVNEGDYVEAYAGDSTSVIKVTRVEILDAPPIPNKIKCICGRVEGGVNDVEMVKSA